MEKRFDVFQNFFLLGPFGQGKEYFLKQFYYHSPSENTIDGVRAALEGHFVHSMTSGAATYLAVIAVLYDLSDECNAHLDEFWHAFPLNPTSPGTDLPDGVALGAAIEPLLEGGFYHWTGLLTTPPCTEGVDWNLMKTRLSVCQRQLDRLKLGQSAPLFLSDSPVS